MAFRSRAIKRKRTLEEMCGIESVLDSAGREWHIRVFTLGRIHLFSRVFSMVLASPNDAGAQVAFLQRILYSMEPSLFVLLRRLLGLPDFSRRWIMKTIIARDLEKFIDGACKANFDMTFEVYVAKIVEAEKKKIKT